MNTLPLRSTRFVLPKDRSFLDLFIKNVPSYIAIFDTEMRYIAASDRFIEESKFDDPDIIGRCHYEMFPNMPEKWKAIHQRGLKGEHVKCQESEYYRTDGHIESLKWEVYPWFTESNTIGGIIIFIETITKYKILENKLKKTIKDLNRSNSSLENYAHICAHDLNEPLRSITNYIQLAKRCLADQQITQANEFLDVAYNNAVSQSNFIKSILTYSKLKKTVVRHEHFALEEMLEQAKQALGSVIAARNAVIQRENLPAIVADRTLITHVLQNLISNSIKFNINVQPYVNIRCISGKKNWIFSVEDNGIGIDHKYTSKIFAEYVRLNNKNLYEGSGLGLSLCKKIINDHGGKIWVTSVVGQGSTFYFTLPKAIKSKSLESARKEL